MLFFKWTKISQYNYFNKIKVNNAIQCQQNFTSLKIRLKKTKKILLSVAFGVEKNLRILLEKNN